MFTIPTVIGILVALVVALSLAFVSRKFAPALRLVDAPDGELKPHAGAIPVTGGIAVVGGVLVGWLVAGVFDSAVVGLMVLLFAVGLIDDIRPLPPMVRLVAVSAIGVGFAIWSDIVVGLPATLLTTILVVVIVNAVNLLDGADGVAGTAAMVSFAGIGVLASLRGVEPTTWWIVAAALVGFLVLNWPPARIFLGDGGAYAVGGLLVASALAVTPSGEDFWSVWMPALAVAISMTGVFLVDLFLTVFRRLRSHARLTGGDRLHVYDRLRDSGWAPAMVALSVGVAQTLIVLVLIGVDVWVLDPWIGAVSAIVVLLLVAGGVGVALSTNTTTSGDSP